MGLRPHLQERIIVINTEQVTKTEHVLGWREYMFNLSTNSSILYIATSVTSKSYSKDKGKPSYLK